MTAGGGGNTQFAKGQNTKTLMGAIVPLDATGGLRYGIAPGNLFKANPVCKLSILVRVLMVSSTYGSEETQSIKLRRAIE